LKILVSLLELPAYSHLADYMERWWLLEAAEDKSKVAARVHRIMRSDHDRCLHDHPWDNLSFVLLGGYWEVLPGEYQEWVERGINLAPLHLRNLHHLIHEHAGQAIDRSVRAAFAAAGVRWRGPLSVVRRRAEDLHRLVIPRGREAWSLFVTWPKRREWGFAAPEGWMHNVPYLKSIGKEA
jgi:hypothetical protein